jgi:membrane fusion protein, multidrug efflux system
MNDTKTFKAETVHLKDANHGGGPNAAGLKENGHAASLRPESVDGFPAGAINATQSPKARRRPLVIALLALGGAAAIAGAVAYYLFSLSYESTDDAFVDGHIVGISPRVAGHVARVDVSDNQWVNRGDLIAELDPRDFEARLAAAEAALNAARAGSKSRSYLADVTEITSTAGVDEASAAVAGAKAAVETARAAVATAKSQEAQAQAQRAAMEASLKQAEADLTADQAKHERAVALLKRIQALVPQHAASEDSLDAAVAAESVAGADVAAVRQRIKAQEAAVKHAAAAVTAAESGVRQAESGVAGQLALLAKAQAEQTATKSAPKQVAQSRSQADAAEADVSRAQAEVNQARLNLSYTKIYAPISGHVTRKSVEQGAYVQVGQPMLALVDPDVWVVANFKETQLGKMRAGQPVTVTVDTHPGVKLRAHVESLQRGSGARFSLLPPENATGNYVKVVQRVPVKIVFEDPRQVQQYGLGPGMSVVPTVKIDGVDHNSVAAAGTAVAR